MRYCASTARITSAAASAAITLAFFGLFGILTVVVKYLQILVDLVFRRKKYIFESIEKLN